MRYRLRFILLLLIFFSCSNVEEYIIRDDKLYIKFNSGNDIYTEMQTGIVKGDTLILNKYNFDDIPSSIVRKFNYIIIVDDVTFSKEKRIGKHEKVF
jgi:hypothetical protein